VNCCILAIMRPILTLFAVVALGFVVILHKKDAPQAGAATSLPSQLPKVRQHNWTKHALDTSRSIAKNVKQERRENEVP
jgi:hypothetical protein